MPDHSLTWSNGRDLYCLTKSSRFMDFPKFSMCSAAWVRATWTATPSRNSSAATPVAAGPRLRQVKFGNNLWETRDYRTLGIRPRGELAENRRQRRGRVRRRIDLPPPSFVFDAVLKFFLW